METITRESDRRLSSVHTRNGFNRDIDVEQGVVDTFPPSLRPLIRDARVFEEFGKYDDIARINKSAWQRYGYLSLAFGTLALLGISYEMYQFAANDAGSVALTTIFEGLAILSLTLALYSRVRRFRPKYIEACFVRERIRQWRFQLFLDGNLVEHYVADPEAGESELEKRWNRFLAATTGGANAFMRAPSPPMLHEFTPYKNQKVQSAIFEFLDVYRFGYQVQYSTDRFAGDPITCPDLMESASWAETISRGALIGALVTAMAHLLYLYTSNTGIDSGTHAALFSAALAAAVVSAGSRAYLVGMTLPAEIENYGEYALGAFSQHERFLGSKASDQQRYDAMLSLEQLSQQELRHYLRLKEKSTFLL